MESKPTHEQAQLQLQVYDLRREARLRQARDWFQKNYHAETFEEAMRIGMPGTEGGTNVGMVIGYWEQACALLNHGLLHEDLFFETNGEFQWPAGPPRFGTGNPRRNFTGQTLDPLPLISAG